MMDAQTGGCEMQQRKKRRTLGAADLRRIAVAADCDTKVVARELAEPDVVQNSVRARVRRAMHKLSLGPYAPDDS